MLLLVQHVESCKERNKREKLLAKMQGLLQSLEVVPGQNDVIASKNGSERLLRVSAVSFLNQLRYPRISDCAGFLFSLLGIFQRKAKVAEPVGVCAGNSYIVDVCPN